MELAKGVRDFPPEEKIVREEVIDSLKSIFRLYGFSPLETPIIERFDTLAAKFGAGATSDVMKEVFKLTDQGKRKLGLRFDLTVPLARYLAVNPMTKMPFKRYAVGRVFRDGPIKLGRYREFWQCDVDVVGVKSMIAEAELISLSLKAFDSLGLDAYVEVNNRKLLMDILKYCEVNKKQEEVIIVVDKLNKIGKTGVKKELNEIGYSDEVVEKLIDVFSKDLKSISKLFESEGSVELNELFGYFSKDELKRIKFNPSLARGLAYYTGTVFEGFLKKSKITSSICGGGRYDNMIGSYMGGDREMPAVGISFGLEPITEAMKLEKESLKKTYVELFVVPIGTIKESLELVKELRESGVRCDIDMMDRGISKNLKYVNSLKIPNVMFVGSDELKIKKFKIKNMDSGQEELLSLDKIKKKFV